MAAFAAMLSGNKKEEERKKNERKREKEWGIYKGKEMNIILMPCHDSFNMKLAFLVKETCVPNEINPRLGKKARRGDYLSVQGRCKSCV